MAQNFCKKHQLQQIAVCINPQCIEKGNVCMRCLKDKHQNHIDDCIDWECYQRIMELQMLQSEMTHWKNQFDQIADMIVDKIASFLQQTKNFDSVSWKFKNFQIPNVIEQIKLQKYEQIEQISQLKKQLEIELKDSVDSGKTQSSQYFQTQNFQTSNLQMDTSNQNKQMANVVEENQFQARKQNQNPLLVFTEFQCQRCEQYFSRNKNQTLPDGYCQACAQSLLQPIDQIPKLQQMSQISEKVTQSRLSKSSQRKEQQQSLKKSSQFLIQEKETSSTLQEEQQNQESTIQVKCDVCQMKYLLSDLYVNKVCKHRTCITCIHQVYKDKLTTKCLVSLCNENMDDLNEFYNEQMSILSEY